MTSKVERVATTMQRLLWESVARKWVRGLMATVPVLGWPIISDVVLWFLETYILAQLFNELARFGVFTSIEWRDEAQYNAYKAEAIKLVDLQDAPEWPTQEREKFKNAARDLIRFHTA